MARKTLLLALAALVVAQDCSTVCKSYGLDFTDGGSFFQNAASTTNFTALQDFTGCQPDVADNILVDPEGNQYLCDNTPMTPDNSVQEVVCPIMKSQLAGGEWAIIILSNNGACDPIDYIRSFSLSVGPQITSTAPITLTVTSTDAPQTTVTIPQIQTVTTNAPDQTSTVSGAFLATRTITPAPKLTYTTKGLITIARTRVVPSVVGTSTIVAPCTRKAAVRKVVDVVNRRIVVTIPGLHATISAPIRRGTPPQPTASYAPLDHTFQRRSPDVPTVTVQDGSAGTSTTTQIVTLPLTTVSVTSTSLTTVSVTSTVTVNANASRTTTITAPAKTNTITVWIPLVITTSTSTQRVTATITAAPTC